MTTRSTVEDVTFYQELGKLIAADVLWMMQAIDLAATVRTDGVGVDLDRDRERMLIGDTRYTRLLKRMALTQIKRLEGIHGDGD